MNVKQSKLVQLRKGTVLLIVLVIISLMSLAAWSFTDKMGTEREAAALTVRQVQAKAFADSGLELVMAILGNREEFGNVNLYDNPDLFQRSLIKGSTSLRGQGYFSLMAPSLNNEEIGVLRHGLTDETAKLNLRLLSQMKDAEQARNFLLVLPEMTPEIADAILDWMDEDDEIREFGAELEYYSTLDPPYAPSNQAFRSLDEILLVRDVTPLLLLGEDANRNGFLELNEDDGDLSLPVDNADGILDRGWAGMLTLHSREGNYRSDGLPKINLNGESLVDLYDALDLEFGEDVAKFVVSYRISGAAKPGGNKKPSRGGGSSGGSSENEESTGEAILRGGIDVSQEGKNKIGSLFDLVDQIVVMKVDGVSIPVPSPWNSKETLAEEASEIFDKLTVTAEPYREGRLNLYQASPELLAAIPDLTEEQIEVLRSFQQTGAGVEVTADSDSGVPTTAQLMLDFPDQFDIQTMRKLSQYITARGDVYHLQVVGFYEAGGGFARIEALIDATGSTPRILQQTDYSHLGRAYSATQLENSSTP